MDLGRITIRFERILQRGNLVQWCLDWILHCLLGWLNRILDWLAEGERGLLGNRLRREEAVVAVRWILLGGKRLVNWCSIR